MTVDDGPANSEEGWETSFLSEKKRRKKGSDKAQKGVSKVNKREGRRAASDAGRNAD